MSVAAGSPRNAVASDRKKGFGLILIQSVDPPNHLVFLRRGIEDKIRGGNIPGRPYGVERFGSTFIKIKVHVTDFADILLRPAVGVLLDGIHLKKDVSASLVLFREPVKKEWICDCFRGKDALHGLSASAVPYKNGDPIFGRMECQDVFRR